MKLILKLSVFIILTSMFFYISCQKELSCENCIENNPPIANAGKDTAIILPVDSIDLDGSASADPDGIITSYKWTKISGPVSSDIIEPGSSKTLVKTLVIGVYKFELCVTDNGGLSAKDTVQIVVNGTAQSNQPPIANAGADQTITLPTNTLNLDGSASTDPDNNISNFSWTKISGPSSFNITNANAAQTQVTNLVQGIYQFELKVTDAGGLFSKDTVQVTINPIANANSCGSSRSQINARLIPVGTLSEARPLMSVALAGNKIVFAGGQRGYGDILTRVDIYDVVTHSWSTAELSVARCMIATIAAGNKIFFAGGGYYDNGDDWHYYSTIDIYDVSTNTWSIDSLSFPGMYTAATVGNKVFFVGGFDYARATNSPVSDRVDIYDLSTNSWATASLSEARSGISAVTVNNKIYFAGGANVSESPSSRVDIYDNVTNSWSVSSLNEPRGWMSSIAIADKIYWAGGFNHYASSSHSNTPVCTVETKDVNTQNSSFASLFQPDSWNVYAGTNAAVKDNKIVFLRLWPSLYGIGKFDIYDIATNAWSVGALPLPLPWASVISVNNSIYVAGGTVNGTLGGAYSNQVWKLEF